MNIEHTQKEYTQFQQGIKLKTWVKSTTMTIEKEPEYSQGGRLQETRILDGKRT